MAQKTIYTSLDDFMIQQWYNKYIDHNIENALLTFPKSKREYEQDQFCEIFPTQEQCIWPALTSSLQGNDNQMLSRQSAESYVDKAIEALQ